MHKSTDVLKERKERWYKTTEEEKKWYIEYFGGMRA